MLLIDRQTIQEFRDLSNSVSTSVIEPLIWDAQLINLQPLLGEEFYHDIITNHQHGMYNDLLNGSEYEYNGRTYKHVGLRRVIVEFFYYHYLFFGNEKDTAFGSVTKSYKDGIRPTRDRSKERSTNQLQKANYYWLDVKKFLDRKSEEYPIWKGCRTGNTTKTFKFKFYK